MPYYRVEMEERVIYEPVIVKADSLDEAKDIAYRIDVNKISVNDGEDFHCEISEVDKDDCKYLTKITKKHLM